MTAPVLAARDVRVSRRDASGNFELVVPELQLAPGEVLAVLGPNGAGKSTLLRTLAGLEHPDRGRVERGASGPVTMVFQRPIVFDGTVDHNLRAAVLGTSATRAEIRARVGEALARFGIEHLATRRASALSGGEMRRLSLARAFVLHPAALLLDEPFDDLDAAAQESLSLDLRRAIAETDVAVAVVTHDLRRALLLADRVAVLRAGRLVQCDAREAVLARPIDPDVARLVGMSNLMAGRVGADRRSVQVPGAGELPLGAPTDLAAGSPVWAGIRPEHIALTTATGDASARDTAAVSTVLSDGITATVTLDWHGVELRTFLLAGQEPLRDLAPGRRVSLSLRTEHLHLMARDPDR